MNWIKRMLDLLNGEQETTEAQEQKSLHTNTNRIRSSKHIETKVTYQYPKGNFRFPIIPDKNKKDKEEPQKEKQRKREYTPVIKEQKREKKVSPEIKVTNKKRFQPTEIPSSVHGFRVPKNDTVIEFELTSTTSKSQQGVATTEFGAREVAGSIEIPNLQIDKVDAINISEEEPLEADKLGTGVLETEVYEINTSEAEPLEADIVGTGVLETELYEINTSEEEPLEVEIIEPGGLETEVSEIKVSRTDTSETNTTEETKEPLNNVDIAPNNVPSNEELEFKEQTHTRPSVHEIDKSDKLESILHFLPELKDIEAEPEMDSVGETNAVIEPVQYEKTEEKEDSFEAIEEDSVELSEQRELAAHAKKERETVISEEKVEQVQVPKKPARSEIPFNVIMLKQDRKKFVDKQKEQPKVLTEEKKEVIPQTGYNFPPLSFLNVPELQDNEDKEWLNEQQSLLDQALQSFKVGAKVVNVTQGPAVTRFEVHPEPGVKVNKITNLSDDIKLNLSAKEVRIEAPIPGKNTIGIEVPNKLSKPVLLHEIISSQEFMDSKSPLTVALGLDISGKPIVTDLNKMPHGLIAGATGSGKSVCINTMLVSLLYKAAPHEVKLLLIDPKMVELAPYNHIPHLVSPVITDVKAATAALKWAVEEMERRYELFAHTGVRDISRYNEMVKKHDEPSGELPYLVIIIDELADLMMVAPGDVEEAICRIAQKARACGIHLILATQRPSVDVITGLIKANIPTRIAFSVSSQVDSRTIIDTSGAEKLLGKGDMLFLENGSSKPVRVQGNFVSDDEIEKVVTHVKSEVSPNYFFEQEELIKKTAIASEDDDLFNEACEFVFDQGGASTSSLQRRFRIGYNRAARLIDVMEEQGIISEARGSKPREVLITEDELSNIQEN